MLCHNDLLLLLRSALFYYCTFGYYNFTKLSHILVCGCVHYPETYWLVYTHLQILVYMDLPVDHTKSKTD